MPVTIKNVHGQYWTGTCWGVREAAKVIRDKDRMPRIEGLELWWGWGSDEAYYYPTDESLDPMEPFAVLERA